MAKIEVYPQYGYGWKLDGNLISTPSPFDLDVIDIVEKNSIPDFILGVIRKDEHPFDGFYITLWLRTNNGQVSTYTVLLHDSQPDFTEIIQQREAPEARGEGYAILEQSCLPNLISKIADLTVAEVRSISPFSEIYYDLKISGDDFDELISWIATQYQVDFSNMQEKYVPSEAEWYPLVLTVFGKRPYRSITIQNLVDAIDRGYW